MVLTIPTMVIDVIVQIADAMWLNDGTAPLLRLHLLGSTGYGDTKPKKNANLRETVNTSHPCGRSLLWEAVADHCRFGALSPIV